MKRVRKTSFYLEVYKKIQAILEFISNTSRDCFNIFGNKRGLIGKKYKKSLQWKLKLSGIH